MRLEENHERIVRKEEYPPIQLPVGTGSTYDGDIAPPIRVLCFGDSLTSGFWNRGCRISPYSKRLAERLHAAFPERPVRVTTDGVPGCLASVGSFKERLEHQYRLEPEGFDWAIILGGTNDLGYGVSADLIHNGLSKAWQCAFEHGARVLALTIPEVRNKMDWIDERREVLNLSILAHQSDGFYTFNLKDSIPYHTLPEEDRKKYWDDGVHLTGDGYSWMGDQIADALIEYIKNDI